MQLPPQKLLPPQYGCYYLFGEDNDALFEAAENLLAAGGEEANRFRVDISELERIEVETRSQGLFGPQACFALIRNADSASVKQGEHLLALATSVQAGNRLIICAADNTWKKALHKKMVGLPLVASCEFKFPSAANFEAWLHEQITKEHLFVDAGAMHMMAERLNGMRGAARQLIDRMKLYDFDEGVTFDQQLLGELLGERSPDDLDSYCHAVAMKEPRAIDLLRHLLFDQEVSDVQLQSWLSIRFNQLLLYKWFKGNGVHNPSQSMRLFGAAKTFVPKEADLWDAPKLIAALNQLTEAEKLLKGASVEARFMVLERLTLGFITS